MPWAARAATAISRDDLDRASKSGRGSGADQSTKGVTTGQAVFDANKNMQREVNRAAKDFDGGFGAGGRVLPLTRWVPRLTSGRWHWRRRRN